MILMTHQLLQPETSMDWPVTYSFTSSLSTRPSHQTSLPSTTGHPTEGQLVESRSSLHAQVALAVPHIQSMSQAYYR